MTDPAKDAIIEKIRDLESGHESGTLEVFHDEERILFYFRNGLVEAVSSNLASYRLGQYLLRDAFLDPDKLDPLIADSRKKRVPIGSCAVRAGHVDEPLLIGLLRRQASRLLEYALEKGFQIGSVSPDGPHFEFGAKFNLDSLLLEVARRRAQSFHVFANQRVHLEKSETLSNYEWYPKELAVLGQLKNYPRSLAELSADTELDEHLLTKVLSVLRELKLVQILESQSEETVSLVKRERFPVELLIPRIQNPDYSEQLEVAKNPSSFISEQFKSLKIRLRDYSFESPLKVINVTSPTIGDGKSLISANMAFAFARDKDRRVALVDCDLRNPSIQKYVGISEEPGLLGYLSSSSLQPHCFMRRCDNLYLMTAGGIARDPVELLSSDRMEELMRFLHAEFDTVILDSPPIQPIADARVLSRHSEGIVMVVRRGKTPYASIENALENVDRTKLMGIVFNDVRPMRFNTTYQYNYYNGNHNGYSSAHPSSQQKPKLPRTYLEK